MDQDGLSGNYNFRIEMRESVLFFGTEYATEAIEWVDVLKTAKRVQEETEKSKDITLFRNTDIFFALYRRKMGELIELRIKDEAKQFFKTESDEKLEIPDFLERLGKGQKWLAGVIFSFTKFKRP